MGAVETKAASSLRRPTLVLSISQLLSWGTLFYTFAVVAPALVADGGWSTTEVSGAFSVGVLTSGLAAPLVAVALERHGPRLTMMAGSAVGGAGMVAWASATSLPQLYCAWLLIGLAMAATLYEPALATLVKLGGSDSRRAIIAVTTVGGLASTLFAPLTHSLTEVFRWRSAILLLGLGALATTALHGQLPRSFPAQAIRRADPEPPPYRGAYRWVRGAVASEQLAHVASTAFLVSFLMEGGVNGGAATAALGLLGLGKLGGRLVLGASLRSASPANVAAVAAASQFIVLGAMAAAPPPGFLYGLAVLAGAASGMMTVLRPLMIVELAGRDAYTAVSARVQRTSVLGRSAGPLVFGAAAQAVGWTPAWIGISGVFLVAAVCFWGAAQSDDEA